MKSLRRNSVDLRRNLVARVKRGSVRHLFDASSFEATKTDIEAIHGVSSGADSASQILEKKRPNLLSTSSHVQNRDEETALLSSTIAPKSTIPPGATEEQLTQLEKTTHETPGLDLVSRLLILADTLVGARLIETYCSYIDAAAIPDRLKIIRFEWAEYSLHRSLSWDDIAAILMNEEPQDGSGHRQQHHTWLALVDYAAKLLGIHAHHLRNEIVAYAPSRRHHFAYSPTGIRDMIAAQHWSPLAERLCHDRALVPFAFSREPKTAAAFTACIERLEREHFKVILVDSKGVIMTSLPKDGNNAESNEGNDVEVHVDDSDYSDDNLSEG